MSQDSNDNSRLDRLVKCQMLDLPPYSSDPGKTDLLDGFISKRARPFSAYLKLEDGKVGFEFPEKAARA